MAGRIGVAAGLLVLMAVPSGCSDASLSEMDRTKVEHAVTGLVDSLFAAMNAHDVDAIAEHYDRSEDFSYVGCTSVRTGFESLEPVMRSWHRTNPDVTFDHDVAAVRALESDVAVATVIATTSEGGQLYWSFVVRDAGDGWRIVHEHESWADCPGRTPHPAT